MCLQSDDIFLDMFEAEYRQMKVSVDSLLLCSRVSVTDVVRNKELKHLSQFICHKIENHYTEWKKINIFSHSGDCRFTTIFCTTTVLNKTHLFCDYVWNYIPNISGETFERGTSNDGCLLTPSSNCHSSDWYRVLQTTGVWRSGTYSEGKNMSTVSYYKPIIVLCTQKKWSKHSRWWSTCS